MRTGCLAALIVFIVISAYTLVSIKHEFMDEYKRFDEKRIAEIERRLKFTMPEGVTPVYYIRRTGAGLICRWRV